VKNHGVEEITEGTGSIQSVAISISNTRIKVLAVQKEN
jgi:hypothetical protein